MVNTKKLKKQLTIQNIIHIVEDLGGKLYKQSKKECIFYSCCHHISPLEHKPKLYYYADTNSFFCYSCSRAFDIIALVQARWDLLHKSYTFGDVLSYICHSTGINTEYVQPTPKTDNIPWQDIMEKYGVFNNVIKPELQHYDKRILNAFPKEYPLDWITEGITIEAMDMFNIRYYDLCNQTIIPCFDNYNNLIGIRVRNWKPSNAKYDVLRLVENKQQFKCYTNYVLYGFNITQYAIASSRTVMIAESEKAVLKLYSWYGHKANIVGLFGGHLNKYRRDMLINIGIDNVFIIPDYDPQNKEESIRWIKKQQQLAKQFSGFCKVFIVPNYEHKIIRKNNATDSDRKTFELLFTHSLPFNEWYNEAMKTPPYY